MPAVADDELRHLAFAAGEGDRAALERVLDAIRGDVYRLVLRMVWHPQDAEDLTQEALIRIMTRIGSYRGEAAFRTWAYRVAANAVLNARPGRAEQHGLTFRRFAEDLQDGLEQPDRATPDAALLAEEVKLGCTLGMLLCLDRDHRLAYVLSDVFDLPGAEAALICEISPAAFRKRASRARAQLRRFVGTHCGLVNPDAPCRCERRVATAVRIGRVDPDHLHFAGGAPTATEAVGEMERLHDLASLMRNHPDYEAPAAVATAVRDIVAKGRYRLLD